MENKLTDNEQSILRHEQFCLHNIQVELRSISSEYVVIIGGCIIIALLCNLIFLENFWEYWYIFVSTFILLILCIKPNFGEHTKKCETHIIKMVDELIWCNENNLPISECNEPIYYGNRYSKIISLYPSLASNKLRKVLSKYE